MCNGVNSSTRIGWVRRAETSELCGCIDVYGVYVCLCLVCNLKLVKIGTEIINKWYTMW